MVPIKLRLHNFTSYGTNVPELDFAQFHLAAVSGPNGVGKSSLVDSITWALWGESRAGSNADKLVRISQKEMWVDFEFELEGINYKVLRKRALKGGGLTSLEFFSNGKNLTEATIKSTQEKIIASLRMDYEIFVNSSYLRQGRADEFTLKPPTERKEILASILGLAGYDALEEKAKEKAREIGTKTESLNYQILEIDRELQTREEKVQNLSLVEKELKEASDREHEVEKELKAIQLEKELASQKIASLEKSRERAKTLDQEITALKKQLNGQELTLTDFKTILAQEELIKKNDQLLQTLKEKLRSLQSKQFQLTALQDRLTKQRAQEAQFEQKKVLLEASLKEEINKGLELKERKKDLSAAICPTCRQPIKDSEEHKKLLEEFDKLLELQREKCLQIKVTISAANEGKNELTEQIQEIEKQVKTLREDLSDYQDTSTKIDELSGTEVQKVKLSEAKDRIEAETKALEDLRTILKERVVTFKEEVKDLADFQRHQEELISITNKYKESEQVLSRIREDLSLKRTEYGAAQKLVDRFTQLEEIKKGKLKEIETLNIDKNNYEELALAFGKKGIQALLIETIIPEIENEANILLDKLTEGRMKVSLLTQREAKTGGTIETLDIIISDENGARSYETYSGGEAFRVNIAIRLALSRLLTQRAGAKLQFLIIDEGFGTQDTQGRDRIVEAINLIQESFAKILIITHLEELKEVFPARIEVSKNTEGSTFQVIS